MPEVVFEEEFPVVGEGEGGQEEQEGQEAQEQEVQVEEDQDPDQEPTEEPEVEPNQPSDSDLQDQMLMSALLKTLKTTFREKNPPTLPLLNSAFYSKYIMPNISPHPSNQSLKFNLKQTSFKNLPNFLSSCEQELELLTTSTNEKGHTLITSVDSKHKLVRGFKVEDEGDENVAKMENLHLGILPDEAKTGPVTTTLHSVTSGASTVLRGWLG